MTDKYDGLRLALDRVKPCGQWRKVRKHIDVLESDEWAEAKIEVWSGNKAVVRPKIAEYVFAANPPVVAALLTERDELLTALRVIDERLTECSKIPASAAEAYDSYFQDLVRAAIVRATGEQS